VTEVDYDKDQVLSNSNVQANGSHDKKKQAILSGAQVQDKQ
jgi:hypothetical protein